MNTAVINIKTNPQTKAKAQALAKELGLSLSALLNGFLHQLIKTKKVTFSTEEELSDYLNEVIKNAREYKKKGI